MNQKCSLYELIHSLTKNEKGYYVKQAGPTSGQYVKLFKLISAQKTYNEIEIKKRFIGGYIGKNFAYAKNYLYHSILKTLIHFNADQKDAYYYFSSVKILYRKGLYKQCTKTLKIIIERSKSFSDDLSILRAIQFLKLLTPSDLKGETKLLEVLRDEKKYINRHLIVSTYQALLAEVNFLRKTIAGSNSTIAEKKIRRIQSHSQLTSNKCIIDKYCQHMHHEILFLCSLSLRQYGEINKQATYLARLLNDPGYNVNLILYRKMDLFNQLIRYYISKSKFKTALDTINNMKYLLYSSKNINKQEAIIAKARLYFFESEVLIRTDDKITDDMYSEMDNFIHQNYNLIPDEIKAELLKNKLVINFKRKKFKQTLSEANDLLAEIGRSARKDIVVSVMIIELAVLFETKKIEPLQSKLSALKRYLVKNKIEGAVWLAFIDFFKDSDKETFSYKTLDKLNQNLAKIKDKPSIPEISFLIHWANGLL